MHHPATAEPVWHTMTAEAVAGTVEADVEHGLTSAEARRRLAMYGENTLPRETPPTIWRVAADQFRDPMNVLLTIIVLVSGAADETQTTILVSILLALNVVLGSRQELEARATVDALDTLKVPSAHVRRDSRVVSLPATELVPGDVLQVEAGDVVPADARIVAAANLEVTESTLTGESAPVEKSAGVLTKTHTALGDRSNLLFQNTSITRGTATAIVVRTGAATEMGHIAGMLEEVERVTSPLQREMRQLTVRLAVVCLLAVAFIVAVGFKRGLPTQQVVMLGIATAISSIPSGLPTFLTAMLSYGSQRLAKAQAIVRNLTDVETLGCVSAINSDKTGTLTLDKMTATTLFDGGHWYKVEGLGYEKRGAILREAGAGPPDIEELGFALALCGDARVGDDGDVVGDPTEAALVVLAAKMGIDAETTRRRYPRLAVVPFDSAYKFMATFHVAPIETGGKPSLLGLVKGAPDVVLEHCTRATWDGEVVPIAQVSEQLHAANLDLAEQGLRVMAFAYRQWDEAALPTVEADPMAAVSDLVFVALVGIIDPLRPNAHDSVAAAQRAGIEVRIITGDHAATARSIAADLDLGPGAITGVELDELDDAELEHRLPELHVFGRVSPEDKLRLVTLMQDQGQIVAATGDAVNDAAALKKADIGVAMGSGSEVTKQAARMVLTDDNFATLVHAIELGRDIYGKIAAQLRYVMAGLFGVLLLMLLSTAFNVNAGNALAPVQLLYVTFFIGFFPAVALSTDSTEPGIMERPPRHPDRPILNRHTAPVWFSFGLVQAVCGLMPFVFGPDKGDIVGGTEQTMTFGVMALSTVLMAASLRRDLLPAWEGPYIPYVLWLAVPVVITYLSASWDVLQRLIGTTTLQPKEWLAVLALSVVLPLLVEIEKALRRKRLRGRPPRPRRRRRPAPSGGRAIPATPPPPEGRGGADDPPPR